MTRQLPYAAMTAIFSRFREVEPEPKGELEHVNAFTLLVAVALSAQATDAGVNKATRGLFPIADTPQKMLALGEDGLIEKIKTIGLFRNKAKNVIKLSRILIDEYGGEVPSSRAALMSLPGGGAQDGECGAEHVVPRAGAGGGYPYLPRRQPHGHCSGPRRGRSGTRHRGQCAGRVPAACPPLADPAWPVYLRGAQTQMRHLPDPGLVPLRGKGRLMTRYQVTGIGNAIVDVLSQTEETFLDLMGITKGIMQLVERERAETLYGSMRERTEAPGGSVGNTIAGLGNLGLKTAFIGRVRDDALGRFYAKSLVLEGTDFPNAPVPGADLPTSRSMIFVTPDGERSMNTYLGISAEISPEDVAEDVAGSTDWLFLEGYLFDKDKGKAAFQKAARDGPRGGGKAGIALSDPFCVDRHRADFRRLVKDEMDYVIGNQHEWESLYQTTDLEEALAHAKRDCGLVVCTRSGADVVILRGEERVEVPVHRVVPVDATGAGDQFAAGFLYGMATGQSLAVAGRMGCIAAAEGISHFGARPEHDVKAMFHGAGLI